MIRRPPKRAWFAATLFLFFGWIPLAMFLLWQHRKERRRREEQLVLLEGKRALYLPDTWEPSRRSRQSA